MSAQVCTGDDGGTGVVTVCACTGDDGGTGCNLIGCFAQSFGAGGKKTVQKRQYHHQIPSFFKKELATMLLMVPEPRETPY